MKSMLLLALPGSAAMLPAFGHSQAATPAPAASLADCDLLLNALGRNPSNAGVTADQARAYKTQNNPQACRDALVKIDPTLAQAGANAATVVVSQPAPIIRMDRPRPRSASPSRSRRSLFGRGPRKSPSISLHPP